MRTWLARDPAREALVATDEASERFVRRLAPGECVWVDVQRPRSAAWLRLYFGLCREIGENQDPVVNEHVIDPRIRVWAGHYEIIGHIEDYEIRMPKSIAFARLTHDEWAELWPSLELAMREHYGIGPQITPIRLGENG